MKKLYKVKSFLDGNMTCLMNARRELMSASLKTMKCLAEQYPEIIKTYDFDAISSLVGRQAIDGSRRTALPDNLYGIAKLSLEEISELKHLNLVIIDKNNNVFKHSKGEQND